MPAPDSLGGNGRELKAIRVTLSESAVARACTRRICGEAFGVRLPGVIATPTGGMPMTGA